jgi:hypothetical protein
MLADSEILMIIPNKIIFLNYFGLIVSIIMIIQLISYLCI